MQVALLKDELANKLIEVKRKLVRMMRLNLM